MSSKHQGCRICAANAECLFYRKYQLAELASAEPERQNLAIQRLREIVFPDDEVASALAKVQTTSHPDDDR